MSVFELERRASPIAPARSGKRTFDREQVIDAIRRWSEAYGAPPRGIDWEPSRARAKGQEWRAERFEAGTWPTVRMVRRQFPTLGEAIAAAGLRAPSPRGRKANLAGSDEVLRAIREWTRRFGDPPTQTDLDPYRAKRTRQEWRIDRYHEGDWPSLPTVRHHFGTLSAAVVAAGLEPPARGEGTEARLARRRRNRLALVDHVATRRPDHGATNLAQAIRDVAVARSARDAHALEHALIALAGTALGWSERVRRA